MGRKPKPEASDKASPFASSGVPLYYQMATVLREMILSGRYKSEERLPPQLTLAKDYGVSRLTAREALKHLEEEGLIRQEQGRGTFVTYQRPWNGGLAVDGSIEDLISMGQATKVRLLERGREPATEEMAEALGLAAGQEALRCRRLRLLRGKPYCYIVNTLPLEIGERIPASRWRKGSVLQYIEEELGIKLREAKQTVRATLADPTLARCLQVGIGAPLLRVDYLIRTVRRRVVEWAQLYYRGEAATFTIDLKRTTGKSRSSVWSLRDHRLER